MVLPQYSIFHLRWILCGFPFQRVTKISRTCCADWWSICRPIFFCTLANLSVGDSAITIKLSTHHYIVPFLHLLQLVLVNFGLVVHRSWLVHRDDWCVSVVQGLRSVSWDSPFESFVWRTTMHGMVMCWDAPNRESKKVSCHRWVRSYHHRHECTREAKRWLLLSQHVWSSSVPPFAELNYYR